MNEIELKIHFVVAQKSLICKSNTLFSGTCTVRFTHFNEVNKIHNVFDIATWMAHNTASMAIDLWSHEIKYILSISPMLCFRAVGGDCIERKKIVHLYNNSLVGERAHKHRWMSIHISRWAHLMGGRAMFFLCWVITTLLWSFIKRKYAIKLIIFFVGVFLLLLLRLPSSSSFSQ